MDTNKSGNKALVVCADDFSMNVEVSAGILELLRAGRLSATACMTQSPRWREDAAGLRELLGRVDAGLHLNFTQAFDGYFARQAFSLSLPALMGLSSLSLLPVKKLRACIAQQLDNFEQVLGVRPDFIDGHQHVHVFPQIRDCLLEECVRRYGNDKPWIRSLVDLRSAGGIKGRVVQAMGARRCHGQFEAEGFGQNTAFAGLYNLQPDTAFDEQMRSWLATLPAGGLIMCHPAREMVADDAHPAARVAEYRYLMSDTWLRALSDARVTLARGFF